MRKRKDALAPWLEEQLSQVIDETHREGNDMQKTVINQAIARASAYKRQREKTEAVHLALFIAIALMVPSLMGLLIFYELAQVVFALFGASSFISLVFLAVYWFRTRQQLTTGGSR